MLSGVKMFVISPLLLTFIVLQYSATALEMQGKRSEAYAELSKICVMLRIFPPEESSPEMEMVALGMKKHLKLGERECLMNMLVDVCGEEIRSCAIDALDLVHNAKEIGDPL